MDRPTPRTRPRRLFGDLRSALTVVALLLVTAVAGCGDGGNGGVPGSSAVNASPSGQATPGGYVYADEMDQFAAAQQRFDLLGINVDAPAAVYQQMSATGKRVIAYIIKTPAQADRALKAGATGLMVSGVEQVVPQG